MVAVWFLISLLGSQTTPVEMPERFVGFYSQDFETCARKARLGLSLSKSELGNGITSVRVVAARSLGPHQLEVITREDGVSEDQKSVITLGDDGSAVVFHASAAEKHKELPRDAWEFTFVKCPT
ncbi:hypothetical protein ABS767_14895 [Sphingomonas sp. ST-64]|uniref:Uncharacterized protein n=2 Tax=Sphingomonas plantiphila TaxID=3163295 RepID=A0ABW8YSP4_9SPHN